MDKDRIKKVLSGLGIAGLITSVGLMTGSCQPSGEKAKKTDEAGTEIEAKASCGQGAEADTSAKASCGKGSCGQGEKADTPDKADTPEKGSCGKGSCGQ